MHLGKVRMRIPAAILVACFISLGWSTSADSTINLTNRFAYGANIGWVDARADGTNGAVIGDYVCSGFLYSANVGWINLGSGSPTNGIQYQNLDASDFGVNQDGVGNLRGYAWGANIGWLNFEATGAPRFDLATGLFSGNVWSANCGWISLSNAVARIQTDTLFPGILDANGLPLAWELLYFGMTNVDPNGDADGDGVTNYAEYLAGTNPRDPGDFLRIVNFSPTPDGTSASLAWTSVPNRFYRLQDTTDLAGAAWADSPLGLIFPDGALTARTFNESAAPTRFYRVLAIRPLSP